MRKPLGLSGLALLMLNFLVACGGGGSSGPTSETPTPSSNLTITTDSILPATLQGQPYSTTLIATGGSGALQWSMSPISATASFPTGVVMDSNTGVLSGTANWAGTDGFVATVKDASSHTATKTFTITAYSLLTAGAAQSFSSAEFTGVYWQLYGQGGFPPLHYSIGSGSFPPGLHLNTATGVITGASNATGTFQFNIRITDSFSPAEIVDQPVSAAIASAGLQVAVDFPGRVLLNRPVSGKVIANGGTPPYTFQLNNGPFPAGIGPLDPSMGSFSGTPTAAGSYGFTIDVRDSSTPTPQTAQPYFSFIVSAPLGRNDTPATATRLGNGSFQASISPFTDSPNLSTPDTDYYRLIAAAATTVHVETFAKRYNTNDPLDTVLELTDANGVRLTTGCNQPGGTTTNFSSPCLNDDISASPHVQDSALDYKLPATSGTQTVLVHVLDWSGTARPDMTYTLQVTGAVDPLVIQSTTTPNALLNQSYVPFTFGSSGGYGSVTWSVASGTLPPGLSLSSAGLLSGTPTSTGTFSFTIAASDSSTPPQVVTQPFSVMIEAAPQITSTSFADAKVGVPYNQPVSYGGGSQPTYWWLNSTGGNGCCIGITSNTCTLTGTPTVPGSFNFSIGYQDALGFYAPTKQFTINILP